MNDMLQLLTEFGAAGLIGMLWLLERRAASSRERQIDESHQRIMASNQQVTSLAEVINRNTRAIESLEQSQQRILILLERQDTIGRRNDLASTRGGRTDILSDDD